MKIGSARGQKATILHKRNLPFEQASEEGTGECLSDTQGKEHTQREIQWILLAIYYFQIFL